MLAEAKMYGDMAELFKAIDYPILQASMLYQITEVEDLLGMMIELGMTRMQHIPMCYILSSISKFVRKHGGKVQTTQAQRTPQMCWYSAIIYTS